MRLFKKLLAIMPMMILFCLNGHASTCDSTSLALMEQTWKEFRAVHPFGFQTVGLKHKGDTCVFVMSEPNSWVKEKDLQQLFEKYEGQLIIKYQPYGIDGQLTDAIGCAKLDSIKFHKLEKEIFNLLYRTDYKPFYTDLDHPVEHVFFSKVPLNYSYSWEELNSVRFLVPYPNGPISEMCIRELCQFMTKTNKTNDIFFSKCRGWIVWVIDEDIDYQNDSTFLINARRFALDSDLICGTFRRWNSFAIIGREREVPVTILPPLRSETILSLASTKEDLSLVFNKDSIKNVNDTLYATPIEMSNMLNDNELGNLMVLTDVLLKSWSENGKVKEYVIDHPQPNSFPFPYGVAHELGDSTKLLWKFESVEAEWSGFYPIVQTGCLPPTYWSTNDNLKRKEKIMSNIAYSYFAELNSPELVRIGMYVALYNIFHRFGIKSDFNRENSWVQMPSFTISNNSWAYGGYQGFLGKVRKGGSSIESLTVSQLQDISKTQAQLAEYLTHLNNSFLDRQNVAEYLTHLNNPFSDKQIQQVLKNIERFLGIASDYKPTKPFEKRKIETTLAMSLDVLKGLSAICTDSQKWKRIESMLSKANTISNNLRAYQIIIHSVVPKDEKRGLKTDDHIKPDSSDHILTEVEVQEKKDEAIKKEKWLIDMRQTARKYGISFKDIKIIEVEKNGTIYKTYIFYYEGNKFEWAA